MRARLQILAALFAVLFGAANAQPILLSGTVGKAPVFLELDQTGDTLSGWYFYLKAGKQIRLEGKLDRHGFFQLDEYVAATNSRTGSFQGRIHSGRWTGSWSDPGQRKTLSVAFDEVRGTLKSDDGRIRCTVRKHDDDFGTRTTQMLDLTLKKGRVKALKLSLSERSEGGDEQRCSLELADLRQVPALAGILLKARKTGGEHRCSVRFYSAGRFVVARIGDPSQTGDDCRGAGDETFCSPRAFWLGLAINRDTQTCKQVK